MAKIQWGEKRSCNACESVFYDMQQNPIICPKCSAEYRADKPRKLGSKPIPKVRKLSARKKSADIQLNNDFESQLFEALGSGEEVAFVNDADEFFTDESTLKEDLRF